MDGQHTSQIDREILDKIRNSVDVFEIIGLDVLLEPLVEDMREPKLVEESVEHTHFVLVLLGLLLLLSNVVR